MHRACWRNHSRAEHTRSFGRCRAFQRRSSVRQAEGDAEANPLSVQGCSQILDGVGDHGQAIVLLHLVEEAFLFGSQSTAAALAFAAKEGAVRQAGRMSDVPGRELNRTRRGWPWRSVTVAAPLLMRMAVAPTRCNRRKQAATVSCSRAGCRSRMRVGMGSLFSATGVTTRPGNPG